MKFGELPVDDLYRHVGIRQRDIHTWNHGTTIVQLTPIASILDAFGLERKTKLGERWAQRLLRAGRAGTIRLDWAEDLCDLAGIHPTAIWGHTYYDCAIDPQDEPDGRFCGRHEDWQAIGHTRHYGIYGTI